MAKYYISIDFYGMELHNITAKNKAEARKKAKKMIKRRIISHINSLYIDKED